MREGSSLVKGGSSTPLISAWPCCKIVDFRSEHTGQIFRGAYIGQKIRQDVSAWSAARMTHKSHVFKLLEFVCSSSVKYHVGVRFSPVCSYNNSEETTNILSSRWAFNTLCNNSSVLNLKGLSHKIFRPVFGLMEASSPECESLILLKLLWCSFDYWELF
jgi:hypothetical protein